MNTGIEIAHVELNYHSGYLIGVGDVQFLFSTFETYHPKSIQNTHRHFVDLLWEFWKHGRMEKEPDSMSEKETTSWGNKHHIQQIHRILHLTLQIEGTKLWNEELKVIPENTVI